MGIRRQASRRPVRVLLDTAGPTYVSESHVTLKDTPTLLFQLLTPAHRRTIISALGKAGYVRYDGSTATRLHAAAVRVDDEYGGDLRRPARACDQETSATS